jgi:hypothetical protein
MNQSLTPYSIQHGINTPDFRHTKCNLNLSYHQKCLEYEIFILGLVNLTCILQKAQLLTPEVQCTTTATGNSEIRIPPFSK